GPDLRVQVCLLEDFGAVLQEKAQQIERLRREVKISLLAAQLPRLGIDGEWAECRSHGLNSFFRISLGHRGPGCRIVFSAVDFRLKAEATRLVSWHPTRFVASGVSHPTRFVASGFS